MAISFTPEQQKVITLRDRNILVSAAAGSGKTAVLVERIIRMITDEEHPVDIDRLLVVTFTNAAASEMRERISRALSRQLELTPESMHLQKQAALLHNAQITTIDSFCLFLIRNNFNDIGLDPGFRVADESEMRLMKQDVMTELLEQCYQAGEQSFLDCVEYFTGGSNDKLLEEYISNLYDFSMSHPWPEEWIEHCRADYLIVDAGQMEQTNWVQYLVDYIGIMIRECATKYDMALRICERPDGPYMYGEMLEQEKEMLDKLVSVGSFGEYYEAFEAIGFGRLSNKRDDAVNPLARDMVKQLRDGVKKQLTSIKSDYLLLSPTQVVARMQKAMPSVNVLLDLVLTYKELLDGRKRKNNMLDFHDMEHFALHILLQRDESRNLAPTPAALEYRGYFAEIMIDEYQDSNLIQELILKSISGEEAGDYNRFMVGDVKQSIYKFRLARPELFIEKYNSYSRENSDLQRIDLHKNFRSRSEVLSSVNHLFARLMYKQLGGIDYDEDAALYQGAEYPEPEQLTSDRMQDPYETECLIAGKNNTSKLTAKEQEAEMIAARIKELYRSFQVTDKETGKLRPVRYADMVILLRTASGWAQEFKGILEKESIPAYVASRTGYFQATEIRVIMQFLHVIDNPLQDIPLYGTMRSFFGGFSEEEIAQIRVIDWHCSLYELLKVYDGPFRGKVEKLLMRIRHYRQMTTYTPIHKILQEILSDTGYLDYVTARPDGEQRRANVEMLLTRASAFENTSYYGLFHFLRYIQQLEKYEVDYGEADVLDERADVVRIMSIHKSKGLEFPVCFVAGLSKKFNMQDVTGRLIAEVDMGIGVDYVDSNQRILSKTLKKNAVAMKMKLDALGEEMRVLYVAMTRAREKLILTALVPDTDIFLKTLAGQEEFQREENPFPVTAQGGISRKIPFSTIALAGSYMDFLTPCLSEEMITIVTPEAIEAVSTKEALMQMLDRQKLLRTGKASEVEQKLKERFGRRYHYEYLSDLFVKTSVSELKKKAMGEQAAPLEQDFTKQLFEEPEVVPYIPDFIVEREGLSGADRGSAYHKVMELLDMEALGQMLNETGEQSLNHLEEEVCRQLELFVAEGTLTQQWRESVSVTKIAAFLCSKLADRMIQAFSKGKLYREQPFVLGISASHLDKKFPKSEQVLIQGIIDVFFEEDEKIIVADYKTDVVQTPGELINRYQVQLDYYAQALERLSGKKVIQKIIYSFTLGQEIAL